MQNYDNPRICGGVFLTYLLDARKQRFNPRKHYAGESDGLSDTEAFADLIRVISPSYIVPSGTTFKQNTSAYKNCSKSTGTYLPFNGTAEARVFCRLVRTDYQVALVRMRAFTDKFIETKTEAKKDERLVRTLIEIIDKDGSIDASDELFVQEDGSAVSKAALIGSTEIVLQALLIGVLDYILQYCPDNSIGRDTVKLWHPTADKYDHIAVRNCSVPAETLRDGEESHTEYEQVIVDDTDDEDSHDRAQNKTHTVNNPVIFNQYGKNGVQISSVGTLVIRHGD